MAPRIRSSCPLLTVLAPGDRAVCLAATDCKKLLRYHRASSTIYPGVRMRRQVRCPKQVGPSAAALHETNGKGVSSNIYFWHAYSADPNHTGVTTKSRNRAPELVVGAAAVGDDLHAGQRKRDVRRAWREQLLACLRRQACVPEGQHQVPWDGSVYKKTTVEIVLCCCCCCCCFCCSCCCFGQVHVCYDRWRCGIL